MPRENTKTNVGWQVYLSNFALRQFNDLHAITGDTEWCYPARDGLGTPFGEDGDQAGG